MDDGYGPPTQADEDWYYQHALLGDIPPVKKPLPPDPSQTTIEDFIDDDDQGWWEDFDEGRLKYEPPW